MKDEQLKYLVFSGISLRRFAGWYLLVGLVIGMPGFPFAMAGEAISGGLVCHVRRPRVPTPISSDVYGVAAAPETFLKTYRVPLNRWGGNTASRYNWKLGNAWNTGRDWFFLNVAIEDQAWEGFLRRSVNTEGRVIVSVPLVGWVAKDTQSHSFSVSKYGPQLKTAPGHADAGNGLHPDGRMLRGNDPADASMPADPQFVAEWVREMRRRFPDLFAQQRIVLALGNEPMLWDKTQRDVHPLPVNYDEYLERFIRMAQAIRSVAPLVPIAGPELWGWPAYFQSAQDREGRTSRDRQKHGNMPFLKWFLTQMHRHEQRTGERLLNYLTLHFYPQAPGVYSNAADEKTRVLRLQSTRSLYDSSYRDPSWIKARIELIPRLKRLVESCYPGLKIGLTEYNWGGSKDQSGALALAELLGIFGREGLDLACLWTWPREDTPAAQAYAMYRNVDGAGKKFGGSLLAVTWEKDSPQRPLSCFAAYDEASAVVTVVVINKSASSVPLSLHLPISEGGAFEGYRMGRDTPRIKNMTQEFELLDKRFIFTVKSESIYHLRFAKVL
jgi:hypothetical protein